GRLGRVALVQRRHVHQMQQQAGARQMLEKADAQAGTFGGTLDQPGNIGNDEALVAPHAYHAQIRHQGGKGIIGHLRLGRGHRADEGALAGIRQAEQTDVRQHLEFQLEVTRLARLARRSLPWRPVGTGLEAGIAQSVPAALSHQQTLAGAGQIADDVLGRSVDHRGTDRHRQDQVLALGAGTLGTAALLAVLSIETTGVAVIDQSVEVLVSHQEHRAAIAAVAAIGTTLLDELLAPEAHHAVTAVAGLYIYRNFVDEFHWVASRRDSGPVDSNLQDTQKQKSPVARQGFFSIRDLRRSRRSRNGG